MIALIVCGMVAMLAWLLVSERLRRWHITAPVAMVLLGIGTGFFFVEEITTELNTDVAERVAELILAMLLFIDAIEVRGGYLGRERGIAARLLALAFPISLVLAVLVGIPLLGASSLIAVLVIALVVIPLDFAPAAGFLRDGGIPQRVRHGLAVESGYVDAIRAPIFAFALVAIRYPDESHGVLDILEHALPDIGFAILFGVGIGGFVGLLTRGALRRGWVSGHGIRLGMVLIPLITYACSVAVHGNGFVAAFIAGITYRLTRFKGEGTRDEARLKEEVSLLDGIGENASLLMWFVFGSTVSIIFLTPVEWAWILFGVLALTVLRFVPVVLAFIGSKVPFRERAVFGLMGPRGTSTIVFGLLAFNAMQNDDDVAVLYVMVVTVLASVILHGFFGTRLSKRILGRGAADGSTISSPIREERPRA